MKSKNYILLVLATGLMTGSMVSCSDFWIRNHRHLSMIRMSFKQLPAHSLL